jgi:uncharacterized NAD(P)/FAD-binding protein YdhS
VATETADLVIVGGGPAAAHLLDALARRSRVVGRVVVIERSEVVGTGLPYGEAAGEEHTLGRIPWRRRDRGVELRSMFVAAARELDVLVQTEAEAVRLGRAAGGGWEVETDRGRVVAERAVLATGAWHVHRLAHLERAVDWRWDVRRLASVRDDEDVLVVGASQSAIDLATALARPGRVVTLASRSGLFPSVWAPLGASRRPPGAAHELDRLRKRATPTVRLADLLRAVRLDVRRLDPPAALPWLDGVATLARDLRAAREARSEDREIPWQAVLWATVPAVFDLFPRLVAEDRIALAPMWTSCLRYLEAIHIDLAQRVLDLVEAGLVRICALGDPIALSENELGVTATGPLGEARAHRVIDARGHDPDIERSDDAFLRSALAAGHITPARIPFLDASRPDLVTGGVWVDPATFQARDAAGAGSTLYALGPLTLGQYPIYLGLWALRRSSTLIVRHLRRS